MFIIIQILYFFFLLVLFIPFSFYYFRHGGYVFIGIS